MELINEVDKRAVYRIALQAQMWCGLHGLMYTDGNLNWSHAPVSLLPNPFPRGAFEYCQRIQPVINLLVDRISRDRAFLSSTLSSTGKADFFTQRLLDIYAKVPEETVKQGVQVGIFRSDYMLNLAANALGSKDSDHPLQVEINTIAASFACLSHKTANLQRHLLRRNAGSAEIDVLLREGDLSGEFFPTALAAAESIPENPSMQRLAEGLAFGHRHVIAKMAAEHNPDDAVVLFIVQPGERNLGDQRALEFQLYSAHGIKAEFMTLAQVHSHGRRLDSGALVVQPGLQPSAAPSSTTGPITAGEYAVSVVYYRAGYMPNDYPTEAEWHAREMMEHSAAAKCPSVGYQLVGTKKIQQVLADAGVCERFLSASEACDLRLSFAGQFAMGPEITEDGLRAMEGAMADGSNWVLKPQREGGGNNYYGTELSKFLKEHQGDPVLAGYILMQRIFPPVRKSVFFRKGEVVIQQSNSELGVYGTFVGEGGEVLLNEYAGFLLRTKSQGCDEGGVATGYAVLDSIALIN